MLLSKRVTTFNLFKDLAMRSGSIMDKMLAEKSRFSMAQLSESRDFSNWSRHGCCCSTQPPSLPQEPTWQQRLAIPVKQMNEAMFGWSKSYLEIPQNCHQQSPIAGRESQPWRGAFPVESCQEQADPEGGQQLETFSRKSSKLWKQAKLKNVHFWLSGLTL